MDKSLKLTKRRILPNLEVSFLGLGTVKFGRNQQVKNKSADGFALPSDQEIQELLGIAAEHGLNYIDTAPAYGISEERIGKNLKNRSAFVISTKVGESFDGEQSTYDFSKAALEKSVTESLVKLKTDYLDIVFVHCPRNDLEILQQTPVLETLNQFKENGSIRAIGASTHSVDGGLYCLQHCDLAMIPFNPGYQEHLPVVMNAEKLGKKVVLKKALYSGHLNSPDDLKNCFSVAYQYPAIASLIAGTINKKHLLENIETAITLSNEH